MRLVLLLAVLLGACSTSRSAAPTVIPAASPLHRASGNPSARQAGAPVPPPIAARHLALDAATDGPAPASRVTPSPEPTEGVNDGQGLDPSSASFLASRPAQGQSHSELGAVPARPAGVAIRSDTLPPSGDGRHQPVLASPEPTAELGTAIMSGLFSHMGNAPVNARYAAIPWGSGIRVRLCAKRCATVISSDRGPSLAFQRAGRVADLSVALFEYVCGVPASRGLCVGTLEGLRAAQ